MRHGGILAAEPGTEAVWDCIFGSVRMAATFRIGPLAASMMRLSGRMFSWMERRRRKAFLVA